MNVYFLLMHCTVSKTVLYYLPSFFTRWWHMPLMLQRKGINCNYYLSKPAEDRRGWPEFSINYKQGFSRHTWGGCCYYPVRWWQQKVLQYSSCSVKYQAKERSSLRKKLYPYINDIYTLLQCQSSSGSLGKSIWLEFRGPRFESWLDLNVFSPSCNSANKKHPSKKVFVVHACVL